MPADSVVPANVPALVMASLGWPPVDSDSLRLRTEDGADVEAQLLSGPGRSGVLVPAAPLVPGTVYRLEGHSPCPGASEEENTATATFTAGPAVALPTTSGTLRAGPEQHGSFPVYGGASCSTEVQGSEVTLSFTPSPELVPFLPWVHWTLEVDGQPWATAPHGAVEPAGTLRFMDRLQYLHVPLTVYSVCEFPQEQPPPTDQGLAPGRHVATLRPVLEQSPTPLPALEVSFELTCPEKEPEPEPVPDVDPEPEAPRHEGCSQAGGGLAAFGLLATLRLWRRKNRP
ncbi:MULTISPECIES: hypothetical protein [unclassified Corallococcus]|uniref:hypothetical protein n=1 Tax=unclassified Corallococcus TaxID=2685029 RepID=UPI001A8FA974|nr:MULTISPECIES: hypothetical protein [unclassified Corallococcus]MBN9682725.1 hypothetical protein [Corallococcus sp. NCSPR001]WAS85734.1 hypothetical protein O0N60_01885 [Corallococcus sp. NCRR]